MLSYFPPFDSDSPLLSVMMMAMVGSGAIYLFNSTACPPSATLKGQDHLSYFHWHKVVIIRHTMWSQLDLLQLTHTYSAQSSLRLYISVFSLDAMCHRSHIFYTLDTSYMWESKPPGPFCGWKVCHQWIHHLAISRNTIGYQFMSHDVTTRARCQCCSSI